MGNLRGAIEPSNPPANTPQPPPAKKARAGPLNMLDAILGAPAPTSSASAASLVNAELSVYLQADRIGRAELPTETATDTAIVTIEGE